MWSETAAGDSISYFTLHFAVGLNLAKSSLASYSRSFEHCCFLFTTTGAHSITDDAFIASLRIGLAKKFRLVIPYSYRLPPQNP